MAVDAVASVVLEKLKELQLEESFTKNKVIRNQLKEMQKALQKMSGLFTDAANKETNAENIKKLTNDYLHYLYSEEDSIESFALRITRQRKWPGFLMSPSLFLKKPGRIQTKIKIRTPDGLEDTSQRVRSPQQIVSVFRHVDENGDVKKNEDDRDVGKGVEEEEEERGQRSTSFLRSSLRRSNSSPAIPIAEGNPKRLVSTHSFKMSHTSINRERYKHGALEFAYSFNEEELSIIGYERKVTELRSRLDNSDDWIISVVGEMGSGKTMLARAVYGNRNIKRSFKPACAWVTIFKESTKTDILHNLLGQVAKSEEQIARIGEDFVDRLTQQLKGRRYLIVLDGVQRLDQWTSIEKAFPNERNGSKIILTTCDEKLARLTGSEQPHKLEMLGSKESWAFFLKKAGLKEDPDRRLKERIIGLCRGLPLNIVLLGSLLSTKDKKEWTDILNSREKWQTSDIVMLSYNDLEAHVKLCLIYMTLFPKELDIPVRRLQRLWLAEGFVERPEEQGKFQEDVAQEYFEDLVQRSLIMVSKLRSDGSPRKCRLLGALHDLLFARAQDISLFHVHPVSDCHEAGQFGKRRLIEYAEGTNCPLQSSEYQRLRSYISFNSQKKDTPAKHVGTRVSNMIAKGYGLLRVLDLEGVYKPSLPENLGDLFNLRYLGLRWTFLDKLPKSVGQLPYLETLDLKRTYINRIPPSIWKLKHLQHLNLNEVQLDKDTPLHSRSSLPKLLTLWGLWVNHESPVENGLSKLTHLRELGISICLDDCVSDDEATEGSKSTLPQFTEKLLDWISGLTALRSLRLRSKDDSGYPAGLSLKPFSRLHKLSHMNLVGKLQKLPDTADFPTNIKVLTLSVSHLRQDPMPILGKLSGLTVLRLLANSYLEEEMKCPSGTFEKLEVLKLWKLENLSKWEVEEGAMKKLKELNIRCCSKLENIPSRLLQQKTFKDLILTNMPPEFKRNVEINNLCNVSITVKNFQF